MVRSTVTVSLGGGLAEKLEAIAAAGFDGVEIFHADLESYTGTPRMTDREFPAVLERAARACEVAAELGAPLVGVCSNVSPATIPDDERAAHQLRVVAERAATCGVRVGYEALAWGPHVNTYGHAWRVVERAAHARHFRCFPGAGALDVAGFVRAVVQTGYAGPLSLEIFNDEYQKAPPREKAVEGLRSFGILLEQIRAQAFERAHASPKA